MADNKIFDIQWEIFGSSVGVFIAAVVTLILLRHWHDWNSALGVLVGGSLGWGVGVLLSPFEREKSVFQGYGKAATAFATGFLVSKLDRIFELLVSDRTGAGPLILSPSVAWRPLLFAFLSLCFTTFYVFTSRQYGQRAHAETDAEQTSKTPTAP